MCIRDSWFRVMMVVIGIIIMQIFIFLPRPILDDPNYWGDGMSTFFVVYGRFMFVVGLLFVCLGGIIKGKDSIITKILGGSFWTPLAKISFAAYLIHPLVLNQQIYSLNHGFYYSHFTILYAALGDILQISAWSLLINAMVEVPLQMIESKYLFPRKKPKQQVAVKPSQNDDAVDINEACLLYTSPSPRDS
eukprot:TRINITY_DN5136_c0_g1_i1.p1 TRINITY_DN5136_c0_g1~~TRINITY_DN5136_c0_g1_i1.p1  ORF type:complete len:191 (+),score=38.40 TRINITY_DN5136_c0_g1_i1:64-636(+)